MPKLGKTDLETTLVMLLHCRHGDVAHGGSTEWPLQTLHIGRQRGAKRWMKTKWKVVLAVAIELAQYLWRSVNSQVARRQVEPIEALARCRRAVRSDVEGHGWWQRRAGRWKRSEKCA